MKDENLDKETVEKAEKNMRKWVNLSDEKFYEEMFNPYERELNLPYHGGVKDEELLRDFIEKAKTLDGDGYQEDEARARLKFLTWPEEKGWVVPEEEIEEIMSLKVPAWLECRRENDLCKWKRVYNKYSIEELRFISETIKIKDGYSGRDPDSSVVIDIFRFVEGDDVSLDNFFDIVSETEQGPEKELIIDRIGKAVKKLDPALGATTLCGLYELHTDGKSCGTCNGVCSSNGIIDIDKEETGVESSVIHEFCHGVFYMLSVTQEPAHPNQIKKFYEETEEIWDEMREYLISQTEELLGVNKEEVGDDEWNEMIDNMDNEKFNEKTEEEIDIVRNYQTKNFNEFITVALSNWVCNPIELKESQPEVYDIIEECLADIHEKEIKVSQKEKVPEKVPA